MCVCVCVCQAVTTVTFEVERDVVEERLDQWLQVCMYKDIVYNKGIYMHIERIVKSKAITH